MKATITISAGEKTPEQQVEDLGWAQVRAMSSLKLCLLQPVTGSGSCTVSEAPSGKGDGKKVPLTGNYLAFEVTAEGLAVSDKFGSPRAVDFVQSTPLTELEGKPGIWENRSPKKMFRVPETFQAGELLVITREGQEQYPAPGDYLSIDNKGFLNTVTAAKFVEAYSLL